MKSLQELGSLKDRVALVTGGTGNLGSVITETLLELGCFVVVTDISEKTGQCMVNKYRDNGYNTIQFYQTDLSQEQETRDLIKTVIDNQEPGA